MREYSLDQLKPAKETMAKVNREILILDEELKRTRNVDPELEKLITVDCIVNWKKLYRKGRIISLGPREWLMAWDD